MAKFDARKFKGPSNMFLKNHSEEQGVTQDVTVITKPVKVKKKTGKMGRPTIEKDPLNSPLTLNFTEKEYGLIKEKAGLAPMASYVREIIKKAGII